MIRATDKKGVEELAAVRVIKTAQKMSLKGRKIDLSAGDFLVYVCFPPALSAGPIDRWDRFCKEYSAGPGKTLADDSQTLNSLITN